MGGGGQGRCEQRSEVFVKIIIIFFLWGGGCSGRGGGDHRVDVFVLVKIKKKLEGGSGLGWGSWGSGEYSIEV